MHVEIRKEAGADSGSVRIAGRIESIEGAREVWFDVPRESEGELSGSGETWLLVMLPFAASIGEDIELSSPVDALFLENVRRLDETWALWYSNLKRVEIRAPTQRACVPQPRTAQFFSGGVDSWFTLLRHTESTPGYPQVGDVDELITVCGLDIPLDRHTEFDQLNTMSREVAEHYQKRHVIVSTNLRHDMSRGWKAAWGPAWGSLSHGAGLAAVALLFDRRYSQVKIGSTGLGGLPPWGSHPMTDALFSTSTISFLHDHALYDRATKIERIAQSDYALSKLRVCYAEGKFSNCSRCSKCHRTLLCLDILGVLDRATSFDVDAYRERRHRHLLVWNAVDHSMADGIRALAKRHHRPEVVALIGESIERSRRVKALTEPLKKISWRLWRSSYQRLAGDMIGA